MNDQSVTTLLHDWRQGSQSALDRLMPLVYDSLKKIAKRRRAGEYSPNTFDTTEIVHQAYIQLIDAEVDWQDRAHFYAIASQVMRRVLIDQARARNRQKRGGKEERVTYDEALIKVPDLDADLLDLDRALEKLALEDERKARILECHFFAGTHRHLAAGQRRDPHRGGFDPHGTRLWSPTPPRPGRIAK